MYWETWTKTSDEQPYRLCGRMNHVDFINRLRSYKMMLNILCKMQVSNPPPANPQMLYLEINVTIAYPRLMHMIWEFPHPFTSSKSTYRHACKYMDVRSRVRTRVESLTSHYIREGKCRPEWNIKQQLVDPNTCRRVFWNSFVRIRAKFDSTHSPYIFTTWNNPSYLHDTFIHYSL